MQDKENITAVIATHNNAGTIVRALTSVTTGIRPADRVVVGDNDSTDDTYKVLCDTLGAEPVTIEGKTGLPPEFSGTFNGIPVRIFRKRLSTRGHTLNTAMQVKWQGVTMFAFLDPASWYAPDKISQSIAAFNRHQSIACVVSDCDNHHRDGRVERVFRSSFDMQRLLARFEYDRNFLVRAQVFLKLKAGFDDRMDEREDYEFLLRLSEVGLIYHIPAPIHHNTILPMSEERQQAISQGEAMARQLTSQRRNPNNG